MKIGLIAAYNNNYGSLLQVYALQQVLQNLSYETEIIRYRKRNAFVQFMRLFNGPLLKMKLKDRGKFYITKLFHKDIYRSLQIREEQFRRFRETHLRFSERYHARKELEDAFRNGPYFVALLGSDQVWNPINYGTHFYTMEQVPDSCYKIAYAPSFGVKTIPGYQTRGTAKYLRRIQDISVREAQGAHIVHQLTGRDVPVVCDPTLLIGREEWDRLKGDRPLQTGEYIFCYFLGNNPGQRETVKDFAKRHGCRIVALQHLDEFIKADVGFADDALFDVGPAEFINLIANAAYVFTDSFHGSIFSILYGRRFVTFPRFGARRQSGTNSRIENLFQLFGIQNRWNPNGEALDGVIETGLPESIADAILSLRDRSLAYLTGSLKAAEAYYDENHSR